MVHAQVNTAGCTSYIYDRCLYPCILPSDILLSEFIKLDTMRQDSKALQHVMDFEGRCDCGQYDALSSAEVCWESFHAAI